VEQNVKESIINGALLKNYSNTFSGRKSVIVRIAKKEWLDGEVTVCVN